MTESRTADELGRHFMTGRDAFQTTKPNKHGCEPKVITDKRCVLVRAELKTVTDQRLSFRANQQQLRFAEVASDAARQPRKHVLRCRFAVKRKKGGERKSAAAAK